MQKVFQVNLSGNFFHLEEDGYAYLNRFFSIYKTKVNFKSSEVEDVEQKIAIYFKGLNKDIITLEDALMAVDSMNMETHPAYNLKKKLFRDPDQNMLGGVCSGIAAFFGISKWLIRVVCIGSIFFGGLGIIIYIILWIALPKATSSEQKMQMMGSTYDFKDLKNLYTKKTQEVSDGEQLMGGLKNTTYIAGGFLGNILFTLAIFIRKCTGFFALLVSLILSFISIVFFFVVADFLTWIFTDSQDIKISQWAIGILAFTPIAILTIIGIKLMYWQKKTEQLLVFITPVFWISLIAFTVFAMVRLYPEFKDLYYYKVEIPLHTQEKSLSITLKENIPETNTFSLQFFNNKYGILLSDSSMYIRNIFLELRKSPDTLFHAFYVPSSFGGDSHNTLKNLDKIRYSYHTLNNEWQLQTFIQLPRDIPWRGQKVTLILLVPVGKSVELPDIERKYMNLIVENLDCEENEFAAKILESTPTGFKCKDSLN